MRLFGIILFFSLIGFQTLAAQNNFYDETTLRTLNLTFDQAVFWQQLIDNKEEEISGLLREVRTHVSS